MHPSFRIVLSCSSLIAIAGFGRAQLPNLSAPHDLAGDNATGLAAGDQTTPAIARGASGYLAAWADRRASLSSNAGSPESGLDVFALRLDAAGAPIESAPFPVAILPDDDVRPAVTWNGTAWLVSWISRAPLGSIYSSSLVGVRVAANGALLDPQPISILSYPFSDIGTTAVASDGVNWLVVAQGTSGGSADVRGARLSPAGVVLDPTPVSLLPQGQLTRVQLAHAQGTYLLTWSEGFSATNDDILGRRFNTNLQPLHPNPLVLARTPSNDSGARLASNGAQFLLAWERPSNSTFTTDVLAARISPAGALLDAAPLVVANPYFFGNGSGAAPAWDGQRWYLSWDNNGMRLARIDASGTVLDVDGFAADPTPGGSATTLVLAGDPAGGVQALWSDARAGSYEGLDIYAARLLQPGQIGPERPLSLGASAQLTPDLATNGSLSVLVFRSETSGGRRILAARLDYDGLPLDAQPIELSYDPADALPSVAWDGSIFLVAWERGNSTSSAYSVLARRMLPDGTLLDAAPIVIGSGATPEVAGLNGQFLVAYVRSAGFPLQQYPNVVRVDGATGTVLGPALAINSTYAIAPDVCALGNGWLVVWQRNYSASDTHGDVNAAFVDAQGVPGAPLFVAGAYNTYNHSVAVAAAADQALITWVYGTASNVTRRVQTRRLAVNGTFLDAGALPLLPTVGAEHFSPAVAFDETLYTVAFQDLRAASSSLDLRSDLYAARVALDGTRLDGAGFGLETSPLSEVGPALAGLPARRTLLARSTLRPEAPLAAFRLATRTLDGPCPTPVAYCTAKTNSLGTLPAIGSAGSASISGGNFQLTLGNGVPSAAATLFHGTAPASAPFFQGVRCAAWPIVRSPLTQIDALGQASVAPSVPPSWAGQTRYYQWWMRDGNNPDGSGVSLSNALAVTYCP